MHDPWVELSLEAGSLAHHGMLQARWLTSCQGSPVSTCQLTSGVLGLLMDLYLALYRFWGSKSRPWVQQTLCPLSSLPSPKAQEESKAPKANKWLTRTAIQINPCFHGSLWVASEPHRIVEQSKWSKPWGVGYSIPAEQNSLELSWVSLRVYEERNLVCKCWMSKRIQSITKRKLPGAPSCPWVRQPPI